MSAITAVWVDGLFCDSSWEIPNIEPDAHALRFYMTLSEGSSEQMVMCSDNPTTTQVDTWLRLFGLRFSTVYHNAETDSRKRMERQLQFCGAQQSKLVLFVGGRFIDCNNAADLGVPSLRYLAPNSAAAWEPDQRSSWQQAVAKQGG